MAGSLGYASRLTVRDDVGGRLGDPELLDGGDIHTCPKVLQLVRLLQAANHVVVHTGAGVSTSAGIPDFRGPNGVWTLQKRGQPLPAATCPFELARPTYTHQALLALQRAGKLAYLVSCNVDCLHQRSGFPRHMLAELHGNCFAERCSRCGAEAVRDFEQTTVGFKRTGRTCVHCGGSMRDQVLDWDDALPPRELELAEQHSSKADLVITLGTSLQIHPACNLPLKTVKAGGKLVIVNLQPTPKDTAASLVIRRRCDDVMRVVMAALQLQVPRYVRHDALLVRHVTGNGSVAQGTCFTLHICSSHGPKCPIPWLAAIHVAFPDGDACASNAHKDGAKRKRVDVQTACGDKDGDDDGAPPPGFHAWHLLPGTAPWKLACLASPVAGVDAGLRPSVRVLLRLTFSPGCTAQHHELEYVAQLTHASAERVYTDIRSVDVAVT
jgi:mono-ADP-ribosyltransferase sirtuin 6